MSYITYHNNSNLLRKIKKLDATKWLVHHVIFSFILCELGDIDPSKCYKLLKSVYIIYFKTKIIKINNRKFKKTKKIKKLIYATNF